MKHKNYIHSRRVLGLAPNAEWADLRRIYRELVKQWHPDRFTGNSEERRKAEENTKEITKAYKLLADYYKSHGTLPPANEPSSVAAPVSGSEAPRQSAPVGQGPVPSHHPSGNRPEESVRTAGPNFLESGWRFILVVSAAVFLGYALLPDAPQEQANAPGPDSDSPGEHVPSTGVQTAGNQRFIERGTKFGEVHAIQGNPTSVEGDVWHYGKSRIHFSKGKVTGWANHPDNPLKIHNHSIGGTSQLPVIAFFTLGSTKSEVRTIQGSPWRESEHEWVYGASRIFFRDGLVTGWDESPYHPLKAKK
jgi:hypothetical protein